MKMLFTLKIVNFFSLGSVSFSFRPAIGTRCMSLFFHLMKFIGWVRMTHFGTSSKEDS